MEYTYANRKDGRTITAHKFEAWLVGDDPTDYCVGFVKGDKVTCQAALDKYHGDSLWELSKVSLDGYTSTQYISTPIPYRVDLSKSTMTSRGNASDSEEKCRIAQFHRGQLRT